MQITGKDSISSLIKNWSNNTSTITTNCDEQILVKVNVVDNGDGTIRRNNFFYLHRGVVNDFNAALSDILLPIFADAVVAGRENNLKKFNEGDISDILIFEGKLCVLIQNKLYTANL